jgi:hypothetical protein
MAYILTFNLALQVIAAFMIFLIGYLALFISFMISLAIAKGIYEGTKGVWTYAVRDSSKPPNSAAAVCRKAAVLVAETTLLPSKSAFPNL